MAQLDHQLPMLQLIAQPDHKKPLPGINLPQVTTSRPKRDTKFPVNLTYKYCVLLLGNIYMCVYKLNFNCPWTIRQATKLNLILLYNIRQKQANYKKHVI